MKESESIKYSTCIYEYVFLNDDFPVMNTVLVSYIVISRNLVSSKHGNVLQLLEFCRVFGKVWFHHVNKFS